MSDKNKQGRATTAIAVPETEVNPNQLDVEDNRAAELAVRQSEVLLATGRAQGLGMMRQLARN